MWTVTHLFKEVRTRQNVVIWKNVQSLLKWFNSKKSICTFQVSSGGLKFKVSRFRNRFTSQKHSFSKMLSKINVLTLLFFTFTETFPFKTETFSFLSHVSFLSGEVQFRDSHFQKGLQLKNVSFCENVFTFTFKCLYFTKKPSIQD